MEPDSRLTCAELLEHKYFDGFRERFEPELQALMSKNQDQHQTKSKKQKVDVSEGNKIILKYILFKKTSCWYIHSVIRASRSCKLKQALK